MKDENENENRKIWQFVGMLVWRFGLSALVALCTYASFWIKANVPSREQFEALQASSVSKAQFDALTIQLNGVRDEVLRWPNYRDTVKDFESRLRELERKFPPTTRRPLKGDE